MINLILVLVVLGVCWWLIDKFVPLPAPIKTIVTVIAVILLCLLLLSFVGIGPGVGDLRVTGPIG